MPPPGDPTFDWLTPDLAIGGCVPTEDVARLARQARLRLVVDLRDEACDDAQALAAAGIALLHLPTPDNGAIAPRHIEEGVRRAVDTLTAGRQVLVHCHHGIGRSALLALCILVDQGRSPLQALTLAKSARACVSPSPAQYGAWAAWLRNRGDEPPTFDAFAAVAYRHLAAAG